MPPWKAREKYKKEPFLPFWEKERLLREMHPSDAKEIAEKDVFLPGFSKDKFIEEDHGKK